MSDSAPADPLGAGPPLDTALSRPRPGAVLLRVDGEVDTLTAPRLEVGLAAAFEEALDAAGGARAGVVVDLRGVRFLASSGLAVLIRGAHRATAEGGRLHLVATSRAVTRPLQVTGADVLFATHDDVGAAVAVAAAGHVAPPSREVGR